MAHTLNPKFRTLNPTPETLRLLGGRVYIIAYHDLRLNPKAKPYSLNPTPGTLPSDPEPPTLSPRR